jgi:ABC-type glycerol-3-phosphate transport system permease component
VTTVAAGILVNSMSGFAFAKFRFSGKKIMYTLVLLTFMVPFELLSINLYTMMIDFGWIDSFLALIVPGISNGMVIFLFRQFYLGFPDYLIESSKIDGLNWRQIFFCIVFPNSKTVCISSGLVLFIYQWESFLWPVLVTRSANLRTLQIVLSNFRTEHAQLWDLTFAGSILAFLIPIVVIFPLQKFFVAGIISTGTKE